MQEGANARTDRRGKVDLRGRTDAEGAVAETSVCGRQRLWEGPMQEAAVDGADRYGPTNANGERLAELEGRQEAEMI